MMAQERITGILSRVQLGSLIVGVLGVIAMLVGLFVDADTFFESYLFGYLFWFGISCGCLVLITVVHLAGGSWGVIIRRPAEAGLGLLPVLALLFIPVLLGLGFLYPWTHSEVVAANEALTAKSGWLNSPFFIVRTIIYFAVLIWYALYYTRASVRQDTSAQPITLAHRMRRTSGPGIVIFILVVTFVAWDWGMSLEPTWFSGIYGVIFEIGQALTAIAFLILVMVFLASRFEPIDRFLTSKRLQDLGNYMMAFTLFWAYVNFSQLIIQWSNNTVETSSWYVVRFGEGWQWIGVILLMFHFFAPFAILFSRWVKRKRRALAMVAIWMLLMRLVDLFYTLVPAYHRGGLPFSWQDVVAVVGLGGIWLALYAARLKRQPLLPQQDPRLNVVTGHTQSLNTLMEPEHA